MTGRTAAQFLAVAVAGRNVKEVVDVMGGNKSSPGSAGDWLKGRGGLVWRRTFRGTPDQASPARKFPALLLADAECADDAEWIAAELVSNALLYSRSGERGGWFGVEVMRGEVARVAVDDLGGGGVPEIGAERSTGELAEHGRGLLVVSRLALNTGISGSPAEGHTVWALLDLGVRARKAS